MSWRAIPIGVGILLLMFIASIAPGCATTPAQQGQLAQLQKFTKADVTAALALATAAQDPVAIGCFGVIVKSGVLDQPIVPGAASTIELLRLMSPTAPCGAVVPQALPGLP